MSFPRTYGEIWANEFELEYVETPGGDVWAVGMVDGRGQLLRVVDLDTGEDVALRPEEMRRAQGRVDERRASEVV